MHPLLKIFAVDLRALALLRVMLGQGQSGTALETAVAATAMGANGPREHYMRGISERDSAGSLSVRPIPSQDSSLLGPLARSDVLIVRPPNDPPIEAGGQIKILRMDF